MANTVVSIFENAEQAQQAQDYLFANGFSGREVNIKIASYKSEKPDDEDQEPDLLDKITSFFRELFGEDDKEIHSYAAAGKNRTIVTVHTSDGEEAEAVAQILDNYGAIDVKETSGSYFPEREVSSFDHRFADDPANSSGNADSDGLHPADPRVAHIKSRIIQRPVGWVEP